MFDIKAPLVRFSFVRPLRLASARPLSCKERWQCEALTERLYRIEHDLFHFNVKIPFEQYGAFLLTLDTFITGYEDFVRQIRTYMV